MPSLYMLLICSLKYSFAIDRFNLNVGVSKLLSNANGSETRKIFLGLSIVEQECSLATRSMSSSTIRLKSLLVSTSASGWLERNFLTSV